MGVSFVEVSQIIIALVALYGVYKEIRKSPARVFRRSISNFYYKISEELERESENVLLGRPKTKERIILALVPILSFFFVYLFSKVIVNNLVIGSDVLDELFVNNNGEKGMALIMYLTMMLFGLWQLGIWYLREVSSKISRDKLPTFWDKLMISIFDSLTAWFLLYTGFFVILYGIGQYAIYQRSPSTTNVYTISGALLFLFLYLAYVFVSYRDNKRLLMSRLKYVLAFSTNTKLPSVKILLKNGQSVEGFLVPFYSDKNVAVISSPRKSGLKISNVLQYIPWEEISILEITEEM